MVRDRWTGVTFAHVVKGKGLTDDWVVRQLANGVDSLGYPEFRLKADTESSIESFSPEPRNSRKAEAMKKCM